MCSGGSSLPTMLANRSNTSLVPIHPRPFQMHAANAIRPPRARLVESINIPRPLDRASTRKVPDEPSPRAVTGPDAQVVGAPLGPPAAEQASPGDHGDHGGHVLA